MSKYIIQPRILFVSPKAAFMPEGTQYRPNYTSAHTGGFAEYLAELTSALFHIGVDVYVAQPDYRRVFSILARNEQPDSGIKLPIDRVQLAEDRTFFYSKPIDSNSEWENMKISRQLRANTRHQSPGSAFKRNPGCLPCQHCKSGTIVKCCKRSQRL